MDRILEIKKYPDKILKCNCQSVEKITEKDLQLFEDMLYTMRHFSGIGLAAPQIGISRRLIVAQSQEKAFLLANPEVIMVKGKDKMEEGCLSVPDIRVNIERPYAAVIKGLNEEGAIVEVKAEGLLARVLLHEIDHLNGKLIIDYMNFLKKLQFNLNAKGKSRR